MTLDPNFAPTLQAFANQAGVDPLGAAAIMLSESGLNPHIENSIGAVGINQLIPSNYGVFAPLSKDQYASLSATDQLPYVFKFWNAIIRDFGKGQSFFNGRDLYWLNYKPATFVPGAGDSHVIGPTGGDPALDHGNKGFITAGDLSIRLANVESQHPNTWAALEAQLGSVSVPGGMSTLAAAALAVAGLVSGVAIYSLAQSQGFVRPRYRYRRAA